MSSCHQTSRDGVARFNNNRKEREEEKRRRIAIIEDITELSRLYSQILSMHGHEVVLVTHSGEEAIEAAKNGKFSDIECVLTDFRMGEINGLVAASAISRYNPAVRVIIASADISIEKEAKAAGFKFIRKPFTITELLGIVA